MPSPRLLLGVDGGGTKTVARVATIDVSGRLCVVGSGHAGGSNPLSVGWEAAEHAIATAVAQARHGLRDAPEVGVLAIAGCGTKEARERVQAWAMLADLADRVSVVPDTAPILAEAPPDEASIGLVAGTGSVAMLRPPRGEVALVGGWGYLLGDGGSAYALGRDALERVALGADDDDSPCVRLRDAVLGATGVEFPAEIKRVVYQATSPRAVVAALAPCVMRLAMAGDDDSLAIVNRGADELAKLVGYAARRLSRDGVRPSHLYLAGGLMERAPAYRRALIDRVAHLVERITLAPDAACACARLASMR
ncbi:MAG: N-acetylglucosamine kinase [Lacipirellulaceae bacterium]